MTKKNNPKHLLGGDFRNYWDWLFHKRLGHVFGLLTPAITGALLALFAFEEIHWEIEIPALVILVTDLIMTYRDYSCKKRGIQN